MRCRIAILAILGALGTGCKSPESARVSNQVRLTSAPWGAPAIEGREVHLQGLDLSVRQEGDLCWAACLEVAHRAYGIEASQQELARRVLGDAAGTANSWDLWTTGTTRWPRTDGSELEVELVVHPELVLVKKRKKGTALEYLDRAVLPRLGRREPVVIGLRPEVPGQDGHAWLVVGARVGFSQVETKELGKTCLLYTSPSPRDRTRSRMPSSA